MTAEECLSKVKKILLGYDGDNDTHNAYEFIDDAIDEIDEYREPNRRKVVRQRTFRRVYR